MSPPTEADTPVADMDAKLMVATGSSGVQQLKDLVNEQKQDSEVMVVVMAKKQAAASVEKPYMDPHLLALASSGSFEELKSLLGGGISSSDQELQTNLVISEEGQASGNNGGEDDDIEANKSILLGVTAEGNTALHVVATACGQGDKIFTRGWRWRWCLTRAERHVLTTYGDGHFLESARIIYGKEKCLLFAQNSNDDTPLHCAARAGNYNMINCIIHLALGEGGEGRLKTLLRKENKDKETALHEAVRIGNNDIVHLLMDKDSELASVPEDGGASPMYLAIMLKRDEIVKILYDKSSPGKLSFAGPNRQNALHAAVLRHRDLTKLLEWNETHLCPQNKDLTIQRDQNGSTPLHFAAAINFMIPFRPSRICRQVLEANPDALYQPDHAGFFPIHVAASVGALSNVDMFVKKCPGSAGLRDAKGRTFLHVAVEEKELCIIWSACRKQSLSWIMNMVDNDGNTALHLVVKAGSHHMFCPLLWNPHVNLNLPNNRGETPLDISRYKLPKGIFNNFQSIEVQMHLTLKQVGAVMGVSRQDHLLEDNITTPRVNAAAFDESKETEVLKESTGALCIGSVLIATMTFGVTFAVPGGYIADDHNNGGSPILARRHAFDAFIWSNTFAFILSTMATIALMRSGNPLFNLWSRRTNLRVASSFVSLSITYLAAAFALAAYVVLAPVAQYTAQGIAFFTFIVLLFNQYEFISTRLLLLPPLCTRKGIIQACLFSALTIMGAMLLQYWPLIFIF